MDILFFAIVAMIVAAAIYLCIRRVIPWHLTLLSLTIIFLMEFGSEYVARQQHTRDLRDETARQVNTISTRLNGEINSVISLMLGLAAHIAMDPDLGQEDFAEFAHELLQDNPLLINLAAAPDLTVTMVYPMEGNEAVLGLNYLENPQQRADVLLSRDTKALILAGPVDLVQGGSAFIVRAPVFIRRGPDSGKFWGIVSAPLDAQGLYRRIGLQGDSLTTNMAIRNRPTLSATNSAFFGNDSLFTNPNNIQATIPVCSGFWQVSAQPNGGWYSTPLNAWVVRLAAIVISILALLILRNRHREVISHRRFESKLRENEQLLQDAGKLALIGGWKVHADGELSHLSEQSAQIFGFPEDTEHDIDAILELFPESQSKQLKYLFQEAITSGRKFDVELSIDHAGDTRWVRMIGNPVHRRGHIAEVVGAVQDITEKKKFVEMIQRQATYDTVTGLANRFLFENRLAKLLPQAEREQKNIAILFIDLDNFKAVNDNLGHKAGDLLLTEVAHRIKNCTRRSDTVARYSGDEFTVILNNINNSGDAYAIAANILKRINEPFEILEHQLFCSASVGISSFPEHGQSAEELVTNADQAMYEVKKSGRNGCLYFTEEMQRISESRHILHNKLQAAIANEELRAHFQPIVPLQEDLPLKCEALVRWIDNGRFVPPNEFIPLAEETGMINAIDRLVLKKASDYVRQLDREHGQHPCLSVNISPRVFSSRDNSLEMWLDLITEQAADISITVEITERLLAQNVERALKVLNRLKSAGISIAIDDFGTGYSSLSYLTTFPIDIIKIDRAFVSRIEEDSSAATLTDTIISLAQKLSLQVVGEGVETEEQLNFLRKQGCQYAQGYHLGRPMNGEAFESWIADYHNSAVANT
ncbi:EAL domain-containing protein [Porticoccus sp. W117]|uniref:bifunctional diguanylate cyclase/phosphodiesterase n=1 Tax=Porticoccus sp. W117 TaxID=3054777 RepID=UPI002598B287|nr:EAL domain-containing protein [Porticoccus sp. W117]MDM3872315.1 EAL domain-containing protein [Porticoccus sp. W117]